MAFTFRPSENAVQELEKIKSENDLKTNSKAIDYVLRDFRLTEKELREAQKDLAATKKELEAIKNIIAKKTETDRIYNELVGTLIPNGLSSPGARAHF